jgi:hypothetical protein
MPLTRRPRAWPSRLRWSIRHTFTPYVWQSRTRGDFSPFITCWSQRFRAVALVRVSMKTLQGFTATIACSSTPPGAIRS